MSRLFKPTYTRPVPKNSTIIRRGGQRFARFRKRGGQVVIAPIVQSISGERCRVEAEKFYGEYTDAEGNLRRVALCADEREAELILADRVTEAGAQRGTNADRRRQLAEHRIRPLCDHLEAYVRFLANQNNTDRYIREQRGRIEQILAGSGFRLIVDLDSTPIEEWLAEQRNGKRNMSIATSNHYIAAIKGFCNWMIRKRRVADNPLSDLSKLSKDEPDIRRKRRALLPHELHQLIQSTESGGVSFGFTGCDRAMLYFTAAYTGLRASELASLTKSSLSFDDDSPIVTVEAAYSKRRKEDILPLHTDLAMRLRKWLRQTAQRGNRLLWPGRWASDRHAAKMIRADLEAAGIPYEDDSGGVFDFHALRHQFISTLARHGIHPKMAQELARHSKITLTMDHYTHLRLNDHRAALESVPALAVDEPEVERETLAATGTDGADDPGRSLAQKVTKQAIL